MAHNEKAWQTKLLKHWTLADIESFVASSSIEAGHARGIMKNMRDMGVDGEILNDVSSASEFVSDLGLGTGLAESASVLFNSMAVHKVPIARWTTAHIIAYVRGRRYMNKEKANVIRACSDLECEGEDIVNVERADELMDDFNFTNKMSCRKLFNDFQNLKRASDRPAVQPARQVARPMTGSTGSQAAPIDSSIRQKRANENVQGPDRAGNPQQQSWGSRVKGFFSGRARGPAPAPSAPQYGGGGGGRQSGADIYDAYRVSSQQDEAWRRPSMRGERMYGGGGGGGYHDRGHRFDLSIIARNSRCERLPGVHTSDRIVDIKKRIVNELTGGSLDHIKLRYMGDVLNEGRTLGYYGITNEYHTVMCTYKVVGGAGQE